MTLMQRRFHTDELALNYVEGPARGQPVACLHGTVSRWQLWRSVLRAGRCWGLCRRRHLLNLKVHVRIPALEDSAQVPVERPKCDGACACCDWVRLAQDCIQLGLR
jgi:hypothetical protein